MWLFCIVGCFVLEEENVCVECFGVEQGILSSLCNRDFFYIFMYFVIG